MNTVLGLWNGKKIEKLVKQQPAVSIEMEMWCAPIISFIIIVTVSLILLVIVHAIIRFWFIHHGLKAQLTWHSINILEHAQNSVVVIISEITNYKISNYGNFTKIRWVFMWSSELANIMFTRILRTKCLPCETETENGECTNNFKGKNPAE